MEQTPCDIHLYDSDEYNDCIKDIVYEAAQDEWIMLDPRFPNLKGITPKRIDEFLANAEKEGMKEYFEDYLQHVMVYDRDDIVKMCVNLGEQIEEKYPGKLHSTHSIFVTTPRGGHEVLSIFAYTNELEKLQIPSNIIGIPEDEYKDTKHILELNMGNIEEHKEIIKHFENGNYPILPDIWLNKPPLSYDDDTIETVFIIDDVIASGEQMIQAHNKVYAFFNKKIEIIPVVLVKRKGLDEDNPETNYIFRKTLFNIKTVGLNDWNIAREGVLEPSKLIYEYFIIDKEKNKEIYESLITVRFPWGSPDGESDKILTTLYESRRGLERIERKQRRCAIDPDKCELK